MHKTICVIVCAAAIGSLHAADPAQPPVWNHDPASGKGSVNWGAVTAGFGTCGSTVDKKFVEVGAKQTPINIESAKAVPTFLPDLRFQYGDTAFEVENTGHVVEVEYEAGSSMNIGNRGGGVCSLQVADNPPDTYQLLQFHFHAPSEHTIDGKTFDMELHLVHRNALGELAVVGILLNKTSDPSPLLDEIFANAPTHDGTAKVGTRRLNAAQLLPADRTYYTYSGSLTTPPCTEGVHWFVLTTPIAVSQFALNRLHSIVGAFAGYEGYANNNRPTLPLNGRTVLLRK